MSGKRHPAALARAEAVRAEAARRRSVGQRSQPSPLATVEDRSSGAAERADAGSAPPGPARWVPWLAFALCVLGLADSAYLTYTHFNPGALVCSTSGLINCQAVTTSKWSTVFGVPVAILGLGYYVVMTALNLPAVWRVPDIRLVRLRLALLVCGIDMVVYLVVAELFLIGNICEYCTGVHIVTFFLFVTVVLSYPATSYWARWVAWARRETEGRTDGAAGAGAAG